MPICVKEKFIIFLYIYILRYRTSVIISGLIMHVFVRFTCLVVSRGVTNCFAVICDSMLIFEDMNSTMNYR